MSTTSVRKATTKRATTPTTKRTTPKPSPKRATVRQLVTSVTDVVALIVAAGKVADLAENYSLAATRDFTQSAIGTAQGIAAGFSTVEIARMVKARVTAGDVSARHVYTVNSAVGFHGMTGRFLLLPGDMPKVTRNGSAMVDARDVQSVIKRVGQTRTAEILGKAGANKSSAWNALRKADRAKGSSTGKGKGKGKGTTVPKTFGALLRQALPLVIGAGKLPVATPEDVSALIALSTAVADLGKAKRADVAKVKGAAVTVAS